MATEEKPGLPVRLVICIDGTYCTPDGPHGEGDGNISNIYRICASVKTGPCLDPITKQIFNQRTEYFPGIGSADKPYSIQKALAGAYGKGYTQDIKAIYRKCCLLDDQSEVWLFGFSRGTYIARAVAGLLHQVGSLKSAQSSEFDEEYERALDLYGNKEKRSRAGPGQIHEFLKLKTRPKPRIQFLGVFDTVKAVNDANLHDITFNDSIQHLRHALALNEDRQIMTPEYIFPDYQDDRVRLVNRTIVQAWFLGRHLDMGGSCKKDGLSLYPLQWMFVESISQGLVLDFDLKAPVVGLSDMASIENPLQLVLPRGFPQESEEDLWKCKCENGIEVSMHDIRHVHNDERYHGRYDLSFKQKASIWPKEARQPFNKNGHLFGHCKIAAQGTIIHPSVYQILDNHFTPKLTTKEWPAREHVDHWKTRMLGGSPETSSFGFWHTGGAPDIEQVPAMRILVCGSSGAGKSTLINRVFGVQVTTSSHRDRGNHDIKIGITHPSNPNLILHDSGGFETGDTRQTEALVTFLKERGGRTRLSERLHLIWFCIEMSSSRPAQTGTGILFDAVSKFASEVPVIVIATKKDEFFATQFQEARKMSRGPLDWDAYDRFARDAVRDRTNLLRKEIKKVSHGHLDACVAVAQDDRESIADLNKTTLDSFSQEKLRLVYIAAQNADIDMKIDFAVMETMKIYRRLLGTSIALSMLPMASTSNRSAAILSICGEISRCFGLPGVTPSTLFEIVKFNLLDDIGHNALTFCAEIVAGIGTAGTVALGGIPVFLASGALNAPIVIPVMARTVLLFGTDLILVLQRAYNNTMFRFSGPPNPVDVQRAAEQFRPICREIHQDVMKLAPRRNFMKALKVEEVRRGFEDIVQRYKEADIKTITPSMASHELGNYIPEA